MALEPQRQVSTLPWGASPCGVQVPGVPGVGRGRACQGQCDTLTVAWRPGVQMTGSLRVASVLVSCKSSGKSVLEKLLLGEPTSAWTVNKGAQWAAS